MAVHSTYQGVTLAIKRWKNNISLECDGIPTEFLQADVDLLAEHLHLVLQNDWEKNPISAYYAQSLRKVTKGMFKLYRGISIPNTAYKILSIVLCDRLKSYLSSIIGPYQCSFRPENLRPIRSSHLDKSWRKQINSMSIQIMFLLTLNKPKKR